MPDSNQSKHPLAQTVCWGLSKVIKAYQFFLSPWVGQHCRFTPSCSTYALIALEEHRLDKALILTTKRLCRCHPWCAGGYDPVPQKKE